MKIRAEVKKEFPKDIMLQELHEIRLRLLERNKPKQVIHENKKKDDKVVAAVYP